MHMKLKLARVEKQLTQKQLASILKMSPATINKIEQGKTDFRKLKLETIEKIANTLDISVIDLLIKDE